MLILRIRLQDTSLAAITTQQRQQWQQQQQQQQQDVAARPSAKQQQQPKRGSLPLQRSIPPGAFHGSVSAAPIAPPSAVADVGGSGGGKRSKQGRAAQQSDDEDWQLPAGGGYESDFDWQDQGRGRIRRKCVRKPHASQAANVSACFCLLCCGLSPPSHPLLPLLLLLLLLLLQLYAEQKPGVSFVETALLLRPWHACI
jgi:hypothetical protein